MGLDTKLYRAGGDGGIDCMAYDLDPIKGGKIAVQAKLYTRTVAPTYVRDLWGTVQHEGATKGIMITASGYGPDSYKFAAGKPLPSRMTPVAVPFPALARLDRTWSRQRPLWHGSAPTGCTPDRARSADLEASLLTFTCRGEGCLDL
jgi:Restriction endonuclease